jgi:predicted MPP superfamily phosphohydrolase
MSRLNPAAVGIPVAAAFLTLGYAYLEAQAFTVREETLPILPEGAAPIRVLHLTDLHLTPRQEHKIAWVQGLASLEPDFVIDTGDNLAHLQAVPALTRALGPLLEIPGAFVMGSNDYYAPRLKNPARYLLADARHRSRPAPPPLPHEELTRHFVRKGWIDLTNDRRSIDVKGTRLDFVGVDDPHLDRDVFPPATPASSVGAVRVGVTHAPYVRVLDQMHSDGCDAIIAGHTHGGQLCVPGFGALVTNCDLDRSRASGLHGWPGPRPDVVGGSNSTWLQVGAGLGTSPYTPFRIACRPEATLITLVPRPVQKG